MKPLSYIQDFADRLKNIFPSFQLAYEYKPSTEMHFVQLDQFILTDDRFVELSFAFMDEFESSVNSELAFIDFDALTKLSQPDWALRWGPLPFQEYAEVEIQSDVDLLRKIDFEAKKTEPFFIDLPTSFSSFQLENKNITVKSEFSQAELIVGSHDDPESGFCYPIAA